MFDRFVGLALKGFEIPQNFQENSCVGVSFFNAVQAGGLFNFQRKFFYKRPRGDCFCDVVLVVFISSLNVQSCVVQFVLLLRDPEQVTFVTLSGSL